MLSITIEIIYATITKYPLNHGAILIVVSSALLFNSSNE
jgi:hypothetical protein